MSYYSDRSGPFSKAPPRMPPMRKRPGWPWWAVFCLLAGIILTKIAREMP